MLPLHNSVSSLFCSYWGYYLSDLSKVDLDADVTASIQEADAAAAAAAALLEASGSGVEPH